MLDVARLRVLVAVARHGSVTAAARALHYSQPSVSHHLSRLEAETGAKLLQRAGRGVRLTDTGRLLAERATEILGRIDAAEAELAAQVGMRQGRVRLAAFPSALGTFVPVAAARLAVDRPGIDLRFTEAEPPEAIRMLRAGYVDVAVIFSYGESDPEADGIRVRPLLAEPSYLVTPDGTDIPAALSAHATSDWIAGCDRCRSHLLSMCEAAGFTPRISFTSDDFVAVQAMVAAGLGVTMLPGLPLQAAKHPGVRATAVPESIRHVLAATYGEPPDPPATSALVAALAASLEQSPPEPATTE